MSLKLDKIRTPRHSEEVQKWSDLLMQWLRSPEFPGDVDILGDLSVTGNATIGAILQAATAKIGDVDGGNYSEFESDGTLKFNGDATVWDDMRTPISSVRVPAALAPVWTAYKGSQVLAFDGTSSDFVYFVAQLPHSYKEGTNLDVHIHWTPEDNTAGNVKWQLTYSWANIDGIFPAETIVERIVATPEVTDKQILTDLVNIDGTGKAVSSMLLCSLARLGGDVEDTYNAKDAYLLEIDFHFEIDTVGSRTELAK